MKSLHSIRVLITLVLLVLMLSAVAVNGIISSRSDLALIVDSNKNHVSENLQSLQWMASRRTENNASIEALQSFINRAPLQDYNFLLVTDSQGNILAATRQEHIGKHWSELSPTPIGLNQETVTNLPRLEEDIPSQSLFGTVQSCIPRALQQSANQNCRILYVEADLSSQFTAQERVRSDALVLAIALTLLAIALTVFVFSITIAGHTEEIIKQVLDFKKGNRKVRINATGSGEFALLSQSVNELFDEIQEDERAIAEKNTRYESLIETMADGLITVLEDGTIESMNLAAERLLGFKQPELVGSHISLLVTDPEAINAKEFLNGFIDQESKEKRNSDGEVQFKTKEAHVLSMRLSMSKMRRAEDTLYIGVLSDISHIKAMEKELRALNKELSDTNEQLEQTVITDGLTELYNRRHFDSMFTKELQRSTRQRTSLSLLVVDIDFFKQFNDRYGHALGDECLTDVAQCIKNVFKRSGDLPARYGGEEFAIILPGCDGLELQERAETLRLSIYDLQIPHSSSRADQVVTVSIGAVTYKPGSKEVVAPKPRELFTEADKALYRAKASGRNRVVFAGQYQPIPILSGSGNYYGHLIGR